MKLQHAVSVCIHFGKHLVFRCLDSSGFGLSRLRVSRLEANFESQKGMERIPNALKANKSTEPGSVHLKTNMCRAV